MKAVLTNEMLFNEPGPSLFIQLSPAEAKSVALLFAEERFPECQIHVQTDGQDTKKLLIEFVADPHEESFETTFEAIHLKFAKTSRIEAFERLSSLARSNSGAFNYLDLEDYTKEAFSVIVEITLAKSLLPDIQRSEKRRD